MQSNTVTGVHNKAGTGCKMVYKLNDYDNGLFCQRKLFPLGLMFDESFCNLALSRLRNRRS